MLVQYVRQFDGQPIGVVVSTGKSKVGWSKCCKKDRFNREMGKKIAEGRANKHTIDENIKTCPKYLLDVIYEMMERSNRYYKNQ